MIALTLPATAGLHSPAPPGFAYQDSRKRRSPLAPAATWVAGESSCVLRTGDAQAAHSKKTGDETGRAIRLPGHEALGMESLLSMCCHRFNHKTGRAQF